MHALHTQTWVGWRRGLFVAAEVCGGSELRFLEAFGVLGYDEVVDAVLYVAVHKGGKVVDGVVDAMVSDAPLRIVVGAYLGRAVSCGDERLAA